MKTAALLVSVLIAFGVMNLSAAEAIPPKPPGYFTDYAGVVSREAALRFNEQLAEFERETSNQVVVAVFRRMESNSSVEDYGQRVAQAWGVGQKGVSQGNGVVMLVFIEDRKVSIQVGYGLEGALPDVVAYDIRARHINPHFQNRDYEGGLAEGIDLIFKAIRGEYKGDGKTNAERAPSNSRSGANVLFLVIFVIVILIAMRASRRRRGYGYSSFGGPFLGGWGGNGGGWSSGSSSGGGFSGFSGGGGSFGGGGSSGSW